MASLGELSQVMQNLDPYAEFRKGQMTGQKFDIQQAMLDEQTKEIEADKAAQAGLAQQAGQPAQLGKMANQMIPDAKLYNDDGSLTTAGQMNDMMVNSTKLAKQGKMMAMQASLIEDPYQRTQAMAEARRLTQTAQGDMLKVRDINEKVKGDSIYAAAMAKDQTQWDAAIKAYQDSGLPLPKGIPTTYSPENAKKIAALAPAALQSKISNDILKQKEDIRRDAREERAVLAAEAKARNGEDGGNAIPKTKDEREGYISRTQTIETIKDIQSLLDDPKYAKIINPSTKFTPQIIANLQENFPEISQKLARIQAYEFSIGGKALTKQEQTILEPIYGWRGLTAEALKKRLAGVESEFTKRNKMDEAVYPGLKKLAGKFAEIESESKVAKPGATSSAEGNAPQAALDYLKANPTQKDAFKKKYGYLPKGY
jgi:hypothetical protein